MKRTLTALAVLLTSASCASAADVDIYGAIDLFVAVNNDAGEVSTALSSGGSTGSYIGIKGAEKISNNLEAVFKLEAGFLTDDGSYAQSFAGNTSRLFHREAWVGLRSPVCGQLSFGRQYTPHFLTWAMTDVNGLSLGTAASPFFFPGRVATMGGDDPTTDDLVRRNNAVFYATPNWHGFTGMLYGAFGESETQEGSSTAGNVYNAAVNYANGPFFIMGSVLYQDLAKPAVPYAASGRDYTGHNMYYEVAATYDFGFTKAAVQFEYKNGQGTAEGPDFYVGQIGATTPLWGGRLNTTAAYLHDLDNDDADGKSFGIRYDYDLSKRTMVYAGMTALFNDDNSQRAVEAGADSSYHFETSEAGNNVQQFFVGMRHAF